MPGLFDLLKKQMLPRGPEVGEVISVASGLFRVRTARGTVLARGAEGLASVGDHVILGRVGSELHVLQRTRKPRTDVKTVKV
jgi:hypothetical protein